MRGVKLRLALFSVELTVHPRERLTSLRGWWRSLWRRDEPAPVRPTEALFPAAVGSGALPALSAPRAGLLSRHAREREFRAPRLMV